MEELKVRKNQNGNYTIVHANNFEEGIEFARKNKLSQIQLRGAYGTRPQEIDFNLLITISKQLKMLSFSGFNSKLEIVKNVDALYKLENLEILYIQDKQNFKINISKFKNLKELSIFFSSKIIDLSIAKKLETLVIIGGYSKSNLTFLEDLQSLKILHIYKSSKIETLKSIQKLTNLSELKLAFNKNLSDIDQIQETHIKKLYIEKCKKLTDFSILKNNSTIQELFITELDSLSFVKSMKKIEKIHFWHCEDGDLNPLFESKTLKTIFITKDKKHYTHTQDQINAYLNNNK